MRPRKHWAHLGTRAVGLCGGERRRILSLLYSFSFGQPARPRCSGSSRLREQPLQLRDQRVLPPMSGEQTAEVLPPLVLAPGGDAGGAGPLQTGLGTVVVLGLRRVHDRLRLLAAR